MAGTRFMRRGTTRFYWCPMVAALTKVPTTAEVSAGIRLDPQLATVEGFSFANTPIPTPNMAEAFTPTIPGEDAAADSTLGFYQIRGAVDVIRAAQPRLETGFMVIFTEGLAGSTPAIGDVCDSWPAQVASIAKAYSAGNEAAMYNVAYTMSGSPAEDVVLVA